MKIKKELKKRSGFTLVELLIVIIIIGILAGGMMLVAGGGTDKANATKIVSDLRNLKSAALMYYADNSKWPTDINGLVNGGYIDRTINAEEYEYKSKVTINTVEKDLVGYKGELMAGGVLKKLQDTAEASGLLTDAGAKYAGGESVYMLVR